jgi:hypothetical protein
VAVAQSAVALPSGRGSSKSRESKDTAERPAEVENAGEA